MCAGLRAFCFIMISSSSIFGVYSLFFAESSSAAHYEEMELRLQKSFTIYGSLELSYERCWSGMSQPAATEFTTSLDLGVRGFVVDPRLMNFDVSGLIERDSRENMGKSYTLTGTRIDVMLLKQLPWRLMRYRMFIPHPIMLRYNRLDNTSSYSNYGITLTYWEPSATGRARRNGDDEGSFRLPTTFFDYDHYDYRDDAGFKSSSNLYSLRSSLVGDVYNYNFLAERWDQKGSTVSSRDTVELRPDYRFFDRSTGRTWDIFNLLRYERIDDSRNFEGSSQTLYRRPMGDSGKDLLLVTGNLVYLRSSADGSATSTYNASVMAQYDKRLSASLLIGPYASIGYIMQNGQDTDQQNTAHFERVGSSITADLSRIFRNASDVSIGNGQNGLEYGVSTTFSTKTRISASAGYALSSTSTLNGRSSSQQFVLSASGPIRGNLSFDARAYYTMQDTSGKGDTGSTSSFLEGPCDGINCAQYVPQYASSQDSLTGAANLYWSFGANSVSAGGAWSQTTSRNSSTESITTSTLQASFSRPLSRNAFFNVFSFWTTDSKNNDTFQVFPRLVWRKGRTLVNVDYDYRRTSSNGEEPVVEQRVFIRLVRYFSRGFRL